MVLEKLILSPAPILPAGAGLYQQNHPSSVPIPLSEMSTRSPYSEHVAEAWSLEPDGGIVRLGIMARRTIRVVAAVVERDERYLITQRRPTAVLPLLWEFPGGRVEEGEEDAEALRREIRERLDADVDVGQMISFISHPYEKYTVDLYLYNCCFRSESLTAKGVNAFRWVSSSEFERYPFTPADQASMDRLLGEIEEPDPP